MCRAIFAGFLQQLCESTQTIGTCAEIIYHSFHADHLASAEKIPRNESVGKRRGGEGRGGGGAGEVWKVSTEDLKIFFQAKLVKKIDSSCGVNMSKRNILTQAQKERPR